MEIVTIKSKFLRGLFDQNTYVIRNDSHAVIIDAGAELEDISVAVGTRTVCGVLLTHMHFDHVWNLPKVLDFFHTSVYLQKEFSDFLLAPQKNASTLIRKNMTFPIDSSKIQNFSSKIEFPGFSFDIFSTPGHSKDSVCILCGDALFTGDTLFCDTTGRVDLFGGNFEELKSSLKIIHNCNFSMAYPGHSTPFSKQQAEQIISKTIE